VLIDWDTLRRLNDQPAELTGYGPIPASLARAWAADAHWRRWTRDPVTGYLLDYGPSVYRPPAALREFIIARDGTCRFPTSSLPAHRADQDHAIPHGQPGGRTSSANMTSLGGRPHRAKHEAGWTLRRQPLGDCDWTSPTGLPYRTTPANYHWMRGQPPPTNSDPPDTGNPPDQNKASDRPDLPGPADTSRRSELPNTSEPPDRTSNADDPFPPDAGDPNPPPF